MLDIVYFGDLDKFDEVKDLPIPQMMFEVFYSNRLLCEEEELIMKDINTRFGGIYDVKNDEVFWFPKNMVHNEEELRKSLKDGICKFSYYKVGNEILGGIMAGSKEFAYKTMRFMEKQSKEFFPLYYTVYVEEGGRRYSYNMDAHGRAIFENLDKNYKHSFNNHIKMRDNASINSQINEVLRIAGINSCNP